MPFCASLWCLLWPFVSTFRKLLQRDRLSAFSSMEGMKGSLIPLCSAEWPAFEVGPPEGTFSSQEEAAIQIKCPTSRSGRIWWKLPFLVKPCLPPQEQPSKKILAVRDRPSKAGPPDGPPGSLGKTEGLVRAALLSAWGLGLREAPSTPEPGASLGRPVHDDPPDAATLKVHGMATWVHYTRVRPADAPWCEKTARLGGRSPRSRTILLS